MGTPLDLQPHSSLSKTRAAATTRQIQCLAQRLVAIEQELGSLGASPAETAVIYRVIAATGDPDLGQALQFSSDALKSGAAALAARSAIIADTSAIQVAIQPCLQTCFVNRVLCTSSTPLEHLAPRYPNAIYLVGQLPSAIAHLQSLIVDKTLYPALVIATPPNWANNASLVPALQTLGVPYVALSGRRGNAMVAIAILETLAELTWQIYHHEVNSRTG